MGADRPCNGGSARDSWRERHGHTPMPIINRIAEFHPEMTARSEEHTSELQSRQYLVCRLLLEKKKHPFVLDSPLRRSHYLFLYTEPLTMTELRPTAPPSITVIPRDSPDAYPHPLS